MSMLGKHHTAETKNKLSIFMKSHPQYSVGLVPTRKGSHMNLGRKLSEQHKKAISLGNMGRIVTRETRNKIGEANRKEKRRCNDCDNFVSTRKALRCRNCQHKFYVKENSHLWKGGITPKDKLERIKFRNTMQKLIFERDNYTCQMCGQVGGYLQVDHIQSWKDYVELRFNMDNCRTLCMECHYVITYGKTKPKEVIWGHNLMKARIAE